MRAKEKKPINIEIGEKIRIYREKAGYSREKWRVMMNTNFKRGA